MTLFDVPWDPWRPRGLFLRKRHWHLFLHLEYDTLKKLDDNTIASVGAYCAPGFAITTGFSIATPSLSITSKNTLAFDVVLFFAPRW